MSSFINRTPRSARSANQRLSQTMKGGAGTMINNGKPPEWILEIIGQYVRAIPRRRRLDRKATAVFTAKFLQLLIAIVATQPQFLEELVVALMLKIPKSKSRARQILGAVIDSVLEDVGVFHSNRHIFAGLPDDWDIAVPDDETPEWRLQLEEQVCHLRDALLKVDERSAKFLRAHYFEGQSLTKIGRKVGLSKQRVSEIVAAARSALVAVLCAARAASRQGGSQEHQ